MSSTMIEPAGLVKCTYNVNDLTLSPGQSGLLDWLQRCTVSRRAGPGAHAGLAKCERAYSGPWTVWSAGLASTLYRVSRRVLVVLPVS